MTGPIRVLVADDQRVVREGLGTLLDLITGIEVVGTAADGNEALALAIQLRPDVVLMDLRMPRCDGIEATRRLRQHDAGIKVLVLTTYADDRSVIDALRAGARGYLTKDASASASLPSAAVPTTSMPVISPRRVPSPSRTTRWSSATRTRIGPVMRAPAIRPGIRRQWAWR